MVSVSYCIMDNIWKTGKKSLPLVLFKGSASATTALLGGLSSQGLSKKHSVKTMVFLSVKKNQDFCHARHSILEKWQISRVQACLFYGNYFDTLLFFPFKNCSLFTLFLLI